MYLDDAATAAAWRYEAAIRQSAAETEGAIAEAVKANRWRLDRIAVSENSRRFNSGRAESVAESIDRAEVERKTGLRLVAIWDAMLDACEVCGALDGKDESHWMGDRPGAVHANCRCTYHFTLS
jgi:hypothetical protein